MELEYTDGCTCTSLTVDGKRIIKMSNEELRNVIKKMLDRVEDPADLQNVWMNIMECIGDYEFVGHCDECGDNIIKYTLEL